LTPAVLEILDRYNAKATFFLLGRNIKSREHIVRQIAAAGHEICSHGYGHVHYWKVWPWRSISDIKKGWQAINAALGKDKRDKYPFRPPYGRLNLVCLVYLLLHRVPIVYWSFDIGDTGDPGRYNRNKHKALEHLKKAAGAVTLAHDFERNREDTSKMILEVTALLLEQAKIKGMRVVTVSELLRTKRQV
jgi:peptidoglycan/xylan/chitin deacetylase (PgdA/CDA1 family)